MPTRQGLCSCRRQHRQSHASAKAGRNHRNSRTAAKPYPRCKTGFSLKAARRRCDRRRIDACRRHRARRFRGDSRIPRSARKRETCDPLAAVQLPRRQRRAAGTGGSVDVFSGAKWAQNGTPRHVDRLVFAALSWRAQPLAGVFWFAGGYALHSGSHSSAAAATGLHAVGRKSRRYAGLEGQGDAVIIEGTIVNDGDEPLSVPLVAISGAGSPEG